MLLTKISILLGTALMCAINVPFEQTKTIDYQEQSQSEVFYHRNMQHSEMLNNYTKVNYKYETNEIDYTSLQTFENSFIDGNIYHCHLEIGAILPAYQSTQIVVYYSHLYNIDISTDYSMPELDEIFNDVSLNVQNFQFYTSNGSDYTFYWNSISSYDEILNVYYFAGWTYYTDLTDTYEIDFDFVYQKNTESEEIADIYACKDEQSYPIITSSNYNEIVSVEYVQPQTIVGVINEFCENYLFSEIPFVQSMTFEVGGQNINLMTYLVILVGLAVGIGLLILLFFLFKWLFYLFGSIFKRS